MGLRARITVSFALGALVMSVVLSLLTYGLTRRSVVHDRQTAAVRQTSANALAVAEAVRSSRPDLPQVLVSLDTPSGERSLLYQRGGWVTTNFTLGAAAVPAALRQVVLGQAPSGGAAGQAAEMDFTRAGSVQMAIGVPLPTPQTAYFEIFDLSDVTRTLRTLALSLAAASAATTLGGALVGRWASRRLLSPLADTARAASAIAGGSLGTRLPVGTDPDLADLTISFNSMVSALQQRIQRDARFASDVSHELRSPLTTLTNTVEVLERRRGELPARSAQALDLLSAEVSRFTHLVDDLLEISRFDAGVADLSLEEVRPAELARHALLAQRLDGVELVALDGTPDIRADKRRVERVLSNLLTNAATHGGGATRVVVGPVPGAVSVVGAFLAVDDHGPGVEPEQAEAIFERFSRGRAAGNRARGDGVGLGLSLVVEHVRLHGGVSGVSANPDGSGARFVVALPLDPEAAALVGAQVDLTGLGRGPDDGGSRGLPRGLGENPRGSRPPDTSPGELAPLRASALGPSAARGTAGTT